MRPAIICAAAFRPDGDLGQLRADELGGGRDRNGSAVPYGKDVGHPETTRLESTIKRPLCVLAVPRTSLPCRSRNTPSPDHWRVAMTVPLLNSTPAGVRPRQPDRDRRWLLRVEKLKKGVKVALVHHRDFHFLAPQRSPARIPQNRPR